MVYGAAKEGLDALAQGLGDALRAEGVRVMIVRPGLVHTRMTRGPKTDSSSQRGRASDRRRRRRGRAVRRLDIAIGLFVGIVGILIAPGIALAAIIAVVVLLVAGLSLVYQRRRARRTPRALRRRRRIFR